MGLCITSSTASRLPNFQQEIGPQTSRDLFQFSTRVIWLVFPYPEPISDCDIYENNTRATGTGDVWLLFALSHCWHHPACRRPGGHGLLFLTALGCLSSSEQNALLGKSWDLTGAIFIFFFNKIKVYCASVFSLLFLFTHIKFITGCKARERWQRTDTDLSLLIKNISIYSLAYPIRGIKGR